MKKNTNLYQLLAWLYNFLVLFVYFISHGVSLCYYNTAQFYSHSGNTVLLFTKMYDACNVYLDSDLYILILRKIFSLQGSK